MVNKLLILSSRVHLKPEVLFEIKCLLESNLNWEELVRRAWEEGVGPLLYRNLRAFEDRIPAHISEQLGKIFHKNKAKNLYVVEKLKPLLHAISDAELRVALTKGLRLAKAIYQNIGLRPFSDVDFVVHACAWPQLERILEELGFSRAVESSRFLKYKERKLDWTFAPIFNKDRLAVEMHFNYLGLQLPIASENELWECAESIKIDSASAKVLSAEHELCSLCLHALQHSYSRLIWLTDIAELASKEDLKWDKVLCLCSQEKIFAPVSYGLHLANFLWPSTLSENILSRFKLGAMERKLLRFFWPEERVLFRNLPSDFPFHTPTLFSLWRRKKLFLALKTLSKIFFPPRVWVADSYGIPPNSNRMFFHYLWRLTRPAVLLLRRLLQAA